MIEMLAAVAIGIFAGALSTWGLWTSTQRAGLPRRAVWRQQHPVMRLLGFVRN